MHDMPVILQTGDAVSATNLPVYCVISNFHPLSKFHGLRYGYLILTLHGNKCYRYFLFALCVGTMTFVFCTSLRLVRLIFVYFSDYDFLC